MTNAETQPAKDRQRKPPKIEFNEEGAVSLKLENQTQLRDLFGLQSETVGNGLLACLLNALGNSGERYRDMAMAMAVELEPTDAIEAMLISQITATHVGMTVMSQKLMDAGNPQLRESYERSVTRLSRTFLAQAEGLKKYRAKAQQVVKVERVIVNEGGQAIVGQVQHGGTVDEKRR